MNTETSQGQLVRFRKTSSGHTTEPNLSAPLPLPCGGPQMNTFGLRGALLSAMSARLSRGLSGTHRVNVALMGSDGLTGMGRATCCRRRLAKRNHCCPARHNLRCPMS